MKTLYVAVFSLLIAFNLSGQQNVGISPGKSRGAKPPLPKANYSVVDRDANSRVWERTTYEKGPSGEMIPHVHRYTELATGMHYQRGSQWLESKEEIEIDPAGGAKAIHGQHQAYFPYNIYDGVIEIVTPDGEHLQSRLI